jgi:hypothetical protein
LLDSSVVQGERGCDLGEVAELLSKKETGSSSTLELVLAGGVVTWLGDLVILCEGLWRVLGHIKSEDRQ